MISANMGQIAVEKSSCLQQKKERGNTMHMKCMTFKSKCIVNTPDSETDLN